jgi:hypothetical protein
MKPFAVAAAIMVLLAPRVGHAAVRLMLESEADAPAWSELYGLSYDNHAQFLANNQNYNLSGYLPADIGGNFSVADIAFDNGGYRMLLESNVDAQGGSELYQLSYASYADLQTNSWSSAGYLTSDIGDAFSVRGFTYGDGAYRLLLESREDANGGSELYLLTFSTYADLLANNQDYSQSMYLNTDLRNDFSVAGFAFDNGVYRMLLETDADTNGSELYLLNFDSLQDLTINNSDFATSDYLAQNIGSDFSVHGFEYDSGGGVHLDVPEGRAVPEPATWMMMILGLGSAGAMLRRRRGQGLCAV